LSEGWRDGGIEGRRINRKGAKALRGGEGGLRVLDYFWVLNMIKI
jgi:hypothetical protein